jgi:hypothetical protein
MREERSTVDDPLKRGLPFVDTVRFWTMAAVVFGHCTVVFGSLGPSDDMLTQIVLTPIRFGTIGFFLIAGMLLGNRLRTDRSGDYFRRRVSRLFAPWLFWYLLLVVVVVLRYHHFFKVPFRLDRGELRLIGDQLLDNLFHTAFWFVPNLLLGMCVLLGFRRYLYTWRLGAGLLALNLFYAVNIYTKWVPSIHSEAVFGFVFYLWLGGMAGIYRGRWMGWLARVSMSALLCVTLMAAGLAFAETRLLTGRALDPLNVLRVTNQVYAVLVLLLLVKMGRPRWTRFVDVRRETFGIYLTHTLILITACRVVMAVCSVDGWWRTTRTGLSGLWLIVFVATYGFSLGLTRLLLRSSRTAWMVGAIHHSDGAQTEDGRDEPAPQIAT